MTAYCSDGPTPGIGTFAHWPASTPEEERFFAYINQPHAVAASRSTQ
jgi:hypothetical protein